MSQTSPQAVALPGLLPALRPPQQPRRSRRAPASAACVATQLPIAQVVIEQKVAHLDRPMDYLVPQELDQIAQPGVRVQVVWAGRLRNGYLVRRQAVSDYAGTLLPISKVISPVPVLSAPVAELASQVAARYAGTMAQVLRLAIPARVAKVEQELGQGFHHFGPERLGEQLAYTDQAWQAYEGGQRWIDQLRHGASPRVVWQALPAQAPPGQWAQALAQALIACAAGGRGALAVLPDEQAVRAVQSAVLALTPAQWHERVALLLANTGPTPRYRAWLSVLTGQARIVIGTRSAMFAPVSNLGLVAVWDDGDELLYEPRAPYPNTRDVLMLRARSQQAALLVGGFSCSPEAALLVESGWASSLSAPRELVRRSAPRVQAVGPSTSSDQSEDPGRWARIPTAAWEVIKQGLRSGPVLVQVPRAGYVPVVACAGCRTPRLCPRCQHRLGLALGAEPGDAAAEADTAALARADQLYCPGCGWAAQRGAQLPACPVCGQHHLRHQVSGLARTAQELGAAFPRVPVVISGRQGGGGREQGQVVQQVSQREQLVLATPGAEPQAEGGYAAVVILDAWVMLSRPSLRAPEQALRRWMAAAALAAPTCEAGPPSPLVIVASPQLPTVQALVRWDAQGWAAQQLQQREQARLPPAARVALVEGPRAAVQAVLHAAQLPQAAMVDHLPASEATAGAQPATPQFRVLIRVPRGDGPALAAALAAAKRHWSLHAGAQASPPHLRLDPYDIE